MYCERQRNYDLLNTNSLVSHQIASVFILHSAAAASSSSSLWIPLWKIPKCLAWNFQLILSLRLRLSLSNCVATHNSTAIHRSQREHVNQMKRWTWCECEVEVREVHFCLSTHHSIRSNTMKSVTIANKILTKRKMNHFCVSYST